jgi:predicted ester cyclase
VSEPNIEKAAKKARELYASNFVHHDWAGAVQTLGVEGLIKRVADGLAIFPDGKENLEFIVAEGDLVMDRYSTTGTQARDLAPIPHHSPGVPNRGKAIQITEMEMFRVVDGKLAEQWLLPDVWGANAQLGLFDPDHWTESICGAHDKNASKGDSHLVCSRYTRRAPLAPNESLPLNLRSSAADGTVTLVAHSIPHAAFGKTDLI